MIRESNTSDMDRLEKNRHKIKKYDILRILGNKKCEL